MEREELLLEIERAWLNLRFADKLGMTQEERQVRLMELAMLQGALIQSSITETTKVTEFKEAA